MWYIYITKSEIHHTSKEVNNMNRKYIYGLTGLLSLLGFIGIFTEERTFLAFFAFAVDFQYFFIKSDEMLEENVNKSAALAFFCGMGAVAAATLLRFFIQDTGAGPALAGGLALGWAVAVAVYALSSAYFGFRENWGLGNDKE